jgi:ATP-dependent DNA ligase
MQTRFDHSEVLVLTRTALDWTHKYPNLRTKAAALAGGVYAMIGGIG